MVRDKYPGRMFPPDTRGQANVKASRTPDGESHPRRVVLPTHDGALPASVQYGYPGTVGHECTDSNPTGVGRSRTADSSGGEVEQESARLDFIPPNQTVSGYDLQWAIRQHQDKAQEHAARSKIFYENGRDKEAGAQTTAHDYHETRANELQRYLRAKFDDTGKPYDQKETNEEMSSRHAGLSGSRQYKNTLLDKNK